MRKGDRLEKGTLTVNERVLLHLREAPQYRETLEAPLALTQQGIAEAAHIRVNHVSRAMKGLRKEGLVNESAARVRGELRRRKVYSLSPSGVEVANAIRDAALKRYVTLDDGSGGLAEMDVAAARTELGGWSVLDVAVAVDELGVVSHHLRSEGPPPARRGLVLEGTRTPETFYGRSRDLEALREWIAAETPPVLVMKAREGMGKTSLASVLAREASESMTVLWFNAGEWETPDALLGALASVLAQLGSESLKSALSRGRKASAVDLLRILRRSLAGVSGLFIFDGCSGCTEETARYLRAILEAAISESSLKVLMITDTGEVPMRRELAASGQSTLMTLRGLDKDSCRKLLVQAMEDAEFEKLYKLAEGHPLTFKLLASKEMQDLVRGKDLTPDEAAMVKYLALAESP